MLRWRLESEYSKLWYASETMSLDPVDSRIEDPWCFPAVYWAGQDALLAFTVSRMRASYMESMLYSVFDRWFFDCLLACVRD